MTRLPEKHTGKNHTVKIIEYNTENTYLYLHIFFSNTYLSSNCTAWTNLWFTTQLPKEFVVFKLFFLIVNDARHSKRFKSRRSLRSKEKSPARTRLGSDFSFSSFFHGRPKRCLLASFIYAYWSCVCMCVCVSESDVRLYRVSRRRSCAVYDGWSVDHGRLCRPIGWTRVTCPPATRELIHEILLIWSVVCADEKETLAA